MADEKIIPAVSFKTAHTGASAKSDELGMRPMQARAYEKRGEQYLLIKSPPASGIRARGDLAKLGNGVVGAGVNAQFGQKRRVIKAGRWRADDCGAVKNAACIERRQQLASLGQRAQEIQTHGIEPLENITIFAALWQPAIFDHESLDIFKPGNDPLLQRR